MTTIEAQVPDYLAALAHEAAAKEKTTLDQIIALALSAQLSAWKCATKWTPAPNAAVPKISES